MSLLQLVKKRLNQSQQNSAVTILVPNEIKEWLRFESDSNGTNVTNFVRLILNTLFDEQMQDPQARTAFKDWLKEQKKVYQDSKVKTGTDGSDNESDEEYDNDYDDSDSGDDLFDFDSGDSNESGDYE